MFSPITIKNFIDKESCDYLIKTVENSNLWENGGTEFWDRRVINYNTLLEYDLDAAKILKDANISCKKNIEQHYNVENIYADTLQIVRWFVGMEQSPHADDMTNTDISGFEQRLFGSIVYLNDNYSGGHTYYPEHNFEIIPESGKLAIHPGNPEHLHGVTKVLNTTRYTIASFWTKEKDSAIDIYK